jgi:hypothetical protein
VASPPAALADCCACAKPADRNPIAKSTMGIDLVFIIFCIVFMVFLFKLKKM